MTNIRQAEIPVTNLFAWHDEVVTQKANPMALLGRYNALLGHLEAQEANANPIGGREWVGLGLTLAIERLAKAGDYDSIGYLLTALESTVEHDIRAEWPTV